MCFSTHFFERQVKARDYNLYIPKFFTSHPWSSKPYLAMLVPSRISVMKAGSASAESVGFSSKSIKTCFVCELKEDLVWNSKIIPFQAKRPWGERMLLSETLVTTKMPIQLVIHPQRTHRHIDERLSRQRGTFEHRSNTRTQPVKRD